MTMVDVDPTRGPVEEMWSEVEAAIVAMALDDAAPEQVESTVAASVARCAAALDAQGRVMPLETRARLARASRLVRETAARRDERGSRELRHDVGSALTAVVASLDVAAASIEEDSSEARRESATAIAYAREAASRAVEGFRRMVPP